MAKQLADYIWFNGNVIPWKKATVHVMTDAMHYGSSVFQGVRAYNTPDQGTCVFRLQEHTRRLCDSAKIYRMTTPYSVDEINQAIMDATTKVMKFAKRTFCVKPGAGEGQITKEIQNMFFGLFNGKTKDK